MKRPPLTIAATFASALVIAPAARAQIGSDLRTLHLAWAAPDPCPDRDAILATVVRLVGSNTERTQGDESLAVAGRVTADPTWRADLVIVSRAGQTSRSLNADNCARLADATALIIALAIDPDIDVTMGPVSYGASAVPPPNSAALAESDTLRAPPLAMDTPPIAATPVVAVPAVDDEISQPTRNAQTQRASGRERLVVGTGAAFETGYVQSGAGVALEGRLGVEYAKLYVGLRGDYWSGWSVDDPSAGNSVGLNMATGGGEGCFVPGVGRFDFRFCGAFDVGSMWASFASAQEMRVSGVWVAVFAEAGVGIRATTWLRFRLDVGPGIAIDVPRFVDPRTGSTVLQPSLLVGRGALTIELAL